MAIIYVKSGSTGNGSPPPPPPPPISVPEPSNLIGFITLSGLMLGNAVKKR